MDKPGWIVQWCSNLLIHTHPASVESYRTCTPAPMLSVNMCVCVTYIHAWNVKICGGTSTCTMFWIWKGTQNGQAVLREPTNSVYCSSCDWQWLPGEPVKKNMQLLSFHLLFLSLLFAFLPSYLPLPLYFYGFFFQLSPCYRIFVSFLSNILPKMHQDS